MASNALSLPKENTPIDSLRSHSSSIFLLNLYLQNYPYESVNVIISWTHSVGRSYFLKIYFRWFLYINSITFFSRMASFIGWFGYVFYFYLYSTFFYLKFGFLFTRGCLSLGIYFFLCWFLDVSTKILGLKRGRNGGTFKLTWGFGFWMMFLFWIVG